MEAAASLGRTLGTAAAGGTLASLLGVPVPWLLGAALAVAVASLAGLRTGVPNPLRDAAFVVLGAQSGAGVSPEFVGELALWPLSFALQMLGVGAVIAATFLFLRKGFGWSRDTALFAALPGAMSFVLAAAAETRADMTRITVVQSVRLLLLIGVLTPILAWLQAGGEAAPLARGVPGTLAGDGLLILASLAGAALGHRTRLPGGLLLGALLASGALHATGLAPGRVPPLLAGLSLLVLGALVGARLKRENRAAFLELLPASLGAFAIGLVLSGLAALAAVELLALPPGQVALAYAPGALEALTVLAFQFGQDPAYVAAHHIVRFIAIALLVPFLARRADRP